MITQETLSKCLAEAKIFWKMSDVEHLHNMSAFLEACIPGDDFDHERDIAYEVVHICARCKLEVAQVVEMLTIAKIEVEVVNNG